MAYAFFALRSPEQLQSEEFLLAQHRIVMETKRGVLLNVDEAPAEREHERTLLSSERSDV